MFDECVIDDLAQSVVIEQELFSSQKAIIDIHKSIEYMSYLETIYKLQYNIVLRDLIIYFQNKKLKQYEYGYKMWSSFTQRFLA